MADFCAYFKENVCRSCTLLETGYDKQIAMKEAALRLAIGGEPTLLPTVRSEKTGFRNKAKIIVSGSADGPILGLLDREVLDCPVHDPGINRLLHDFLPFIRSARLDPYSVKDRKGELKAIILFHGKETYVRFVLRSKESIDRIKKHLPSLLYSHPEVKSFSVNIQPVHKAILEGDEEIMLGPTTTVAQEYRNFSLRLRPQGFVQTNQQVATELYEAAAAWVEETGIARFLELYCGQGAFSFHCAHFVSEATGVEINPEAVEMALENARDLKLNHLSFLALDAGKTQDILREKSPELVLVNPPRRGLSETADLLLAQLPEWILYSSCSVESLETDLRKLTTKYAVKKAQVFDMFPHTGHFESLVLLRKIQR